MAVIDRAQQDGRGIHRTGSQHHNMGLEQPVLASDGGLHALDLAAAGIHMQPRDPSATAQLHRSCCRGWHNAKQLGITTGVVFVIRPTNGEVIRLSAVPLEATAQFLQKGLHRFRCCTEIALPWWLGGIHTGAAMHLIKLFGLVVIGGDIAVAQLPLRRNTLLQRQGAEILFTHALEHPAPDLGIAAKGIHRLWRKGIAIRSKPVFCGVEAIFGAQQLHIRHVLIRQWHRATALKNQHRFALAGQGAGQRATGSTAANDDHVVLLVVDDHGSSPSSAARRRSRRRG